MDMQRLFAIKEIIFVCSMKVIKDALRKIKKKYHNVKFCELLMARKDIFLF